MPRQPTVVGGATGPGRRLLTGLAALTALTALIGGLPLLLSYAAGVLMPTSWSPLSLPSADQGSLLPQVVLDAGWVTWALFCALVAWEVIRRLLGRPSTAGARRRTPRGLAGVLVAAVAALTASTATSAQATPAAVVAADDLHPDEDRPSPPASQASTEPVLHLVERGEALLDLQERYGVPWQRLAEANYDREQPDGKRLQRGHTLIHAGWQLRIPTTASATSPVSPATAEQKPPTVCAGEHVLRIGDDRYTYTVQDDDTLWAIAEMCLGDGARWPDIWDLNQNRRFPDVGGTFHDPDLIYPGWDLVLPSDATPPPEATPVDPAEPEPPPAAPQPTPPTDPPTPSPQPSEHPAPPTPAPTPTASATSSPATPPEQQPSHQTDGLAEPGDEQPDDDSEPSAQVPIAFGAALIIATLAAAVAVKLRRRGAASDPRVGRSGHRRGHRPRHIDNGTVEQQLHAAAHPLDVDRLDTALRLLATGLANRPGRPPDIVGAHVADGDVRLLLTQADEQPPPPWQANGTQWILSGGEDLPPTPGGVLAALPALVTVGSQPRHPGTPTGGQHVLLDLERLGCLSIAGDPTAARDLLRYLASELAMNTWADELEVICAGWPPHEAELLTALNPDRVRAAGPIADQVTQLRQRVRIAAGTLTDAGAADALAGRVHDLAGDSWMPTVLVACDPQPGDLDAIAELADHLGRAGRCALAVVTTGTIPTHGGKPDTAHTITTTPDRAVHVPFLDVTLAAAGLPLQELQQLARVINTARDGEEEPAPPATEPEPWAVGTDAAGSLLPIDDEQVHDPHEAPDTDTDAGMLDGLGWADTDQPSAPTVEPARPDAPAPPAAQVLTDLPPAASAPPTPAAVVAPPDRAQLDPTLDDDHASWYQPVADRPRIRVLGPVVEATEVVDAPGQPPQPGRLLLLAEVLVYLAQAGRRGASPTQIDADLWPGQEVQVTYRRATLSRARQWAGKRDDGTPWLAEIHYKLEDGYLLDWHLFRRLRARGQSRGHDGIADLWAALELVRGVPLAEYERIASTTRSPYNWLATSDIDPDHIVAAIVDTAAELAQLCLASGDTTGARWAVDQAWRADPDRNYDQPWQILLRIHAHEGHQAELEACVHELMRLREAEVEEDLDPAIYTLLWEVLPTGYWDRSREPAYQD